MSYLSTNNGSSWYFNGLSNYIVNSFAICGNDIFAVTGDGGVFLSDNNGASWNNLYFYADCLAISGSNIYAGKRNKVLLSTNNGTSWTTLGSLPDTVPISSLAINGSNIFAGNKGWGEGGIYLSTNNGSSWTAINNGIPNPSNLSVNSLAIIDSNVIATTSKGLFLSTNYGTSWFADTNGMGNLYITSLAITGSNIFCRH